MMDNRAKRRMEERKEKELADKLADYVNRYFKFIDAHQMDVDAQSSELKKINAQWREWCNKNSETYNVFTIAPMFIQEVDKILSLGTRQK